MTTSLENLAVEGSPPARPRCRPFCASHDENHISGLCEMAMTDLAPAFAVCILSKSKQSPALDSPCRLPVPPTTINHSRDRAGRPTYQDGSPRHERRQDLFLASLSPARRHIEEPAHSVKTPRSRTGLAEETFPPIPSAHLISLLSSHVRQDPGTHRLPTTAPFHPRDAPRLPDVCILPIITGFAVFRCVPGVVGSHLDRFLSQSSY